TTVAVNSRMRWSVASHLGNAGLVEASNFPTRVRTVGSLWSSGGMGSGSAAPPSGAKVAVAVGAGVEGGSGGGVRKKPENQSPAAAIATASRIAATFLESCIAHFL